MSYTYKHVTLVGIDGAGNFYRHAKAPTIRRLMEEGAGTDTCLTSIPTISAECWGSMLLGVLPDVHGLNNTLISTTPYGNTDIPSVFTLIRRAHPHAALASFCNWNPINYGILDDAATHQDTGHDEPLTERICACIREEKPEFLFVQFDSVDHAGHAFGYGSEKHLDQIDICDGLTAKIYEAAKDAGILEDTLFLVTADHGGFDHGHGGTTDEEKLVFFAAVGKTVIKGARISMEVKDIPAIITHALGVPDGATWQAKLPEGLFAE